MKIISVAWIISVKTMFVCLFVSKTIRIKGTKVITPKTLLGPSLGIDFGFRNNPPKIINEMTDILLHPPSFFAVVSQINDISSGTELNAVVSRSDGHYIGI